VISTSCSLVMAALQPVAHQQCSYEAYEKKHDMECTTLPVALTVRAAPFPTPARRPRRRPAAANRRCSPGSPTCTTSSRIRVGPSMPATGAWKCKEAKSQHETGASTYRSSPPGAFAERWHVSG
jgi:hypothetical protein